MSTPSTTPVVILGGGYDGLVAACYLARDGSASGHTVPGVRQQR